MSEEFKVIETQEDFDRAINDRLERERNTVRKEFEGFMSPEDVQKKYGNYMSQEDVQEKYKNFISPEDAAQKDAEINSLKLKEKRVSVAMEVGIPYELAGKITGDTEEDMKKDAEILAGFLKKNNPYPSYDPEPNGSEKNKDAAMKNLLNSLKGE